MKINPATIQTHPFAAALLYQLQGEEVEIYSGDVKTTQVLQDYEVAQKNVIVGVLMDAIGDCLIVEVTNGNLKSNVYINAWSVSHVMRVKDPLFIDDVFRDEHELYRLRHRKRNGK